MPGRGPAPAEKRRHTGVPRRGEWVDLPPLKKAVLPALSKVGRRKSDGPWPARTRALWAAWRKDPVTAEYGEADIAFAIDTIFLHAGQRLNDSGELRRRMDSLGLTPKGKRDLRWRLQGTATAERMRRAEEKGTGQAPEPEARPPSGRRARLSVVGS